MLAGFRSFAKSPFAVVLFGLLIVSFAIFGISDVFKAPLGNWVVDAGGRTVRGPDFKLRFDEMRKQAEQQAGQPITPEAAVERGLDKQILNEVALQESLAELLSKIGVRPSDKLLGDVVHEQMARLPADMRPFDPITGKFDAKLYEGLLARNDLTPERYEAQLRDEIAQSQAFSAVANGLRVPRIYTALQAAYGLESRDLLAFAVNPASVAKPAPPTDAQLTAFMAENRAQLTRPETRILSIARFSAKAMEPQVTVSQADVQKTFDFRKDTLGQAETRSLVQIVAPDAKAAVTIAQRLQKGEDPFVVGRAFNKTPIVITEKPMSALPDRKVAAAAFNLALGQSSGPIVGDLGVSVVKVTKIIPAVVAKLESVRPEIEAELRAQGAQSMAYDQTQVYQDAHDAGANLIDAATKAGAFVMTSAPISAQGVDQTGQPVAGLTPDLLQTAFALPSGGESELIEAGKGEFYAVRVERIVPAAMPPLAEIRAPLAQQWVLTETLKRLKIKADELAARIRKGESIEAVAASAGSRVQRVAGISRENAQQYQGLGRDVLIASFRAKPGEAFTARAPSLGFVVGKIDAVKAADPVQMARITEDQRPQATMTVFRDVGESARAGARAALKTKVNLVAAQQAIGVDTTALAKDKDPKSGKAGAKDQ